MFHAGRAITEVQNRYSIGRSQIAEALEVNTQQVDRWKKSPNIKMSVALKICEVSGIGIAQFVKLGS
jgi:DNA-binding XRE family transcriptional regulator